MHTFRIRSREIMPLPTHLLKAARRAPIDSIPEPHEQLDARLARAAAAFGEQCSGTARCPSLPTVLASYARFHRHVFDPQTPCSERRVLVIRESFSDIVGVGQLHLGFQRLTALALAAGRAIVFSTCETRSDVWRVRGDDLLNRAAPYNCSQSHLNIADFYRGYNGIDLRWTPARKRLMRRCRVSELAVDFNDPRLGPIGCEISGCRTNSSAMNKFKDCRSHAGLRGCNKGWNPDGMYCDLNAKRRCPAAWRMFEDARRETEPARQTLSSRQLATAPLLAWYNVRRDAGGNGFPIWQLLLGNGVTSFAAPNGSTVGIASLAEIQASLLCPYRCWSHANFQPGPRLRRAMGAALVGLPASQNLVCAHARTLHVDDQRCFPNGRGCRKVEFRRLSYWDTRQSITHSETGAPVRLARMAYDGSGIGGHSLTAGRASPLWWQLELPKPLPVCKVTVRQGLPKPSRLGRHELLRLGMNTSVSLWAARGQLLLRVPLLAGANGDLVADVPMMADTKKVRIEHHFDDSRRRRKAVLSLSDVQIYTDEPLSWASVDSYVTGNQTCAMLRWRGRCIGWGPKAQTVLGALGGYSGLMRCVSRPSFQASLFGRQRGWRQKMQGERGNEANGHTAPTESAAPGRGDVATPFYLSTDALGLQQLAAETYPKALLAIAAVPVPSWEAERRPSEYVKVVADFEVLRLCDAIVSPIESTYANAAVEASLLLRRHLTAGTMCYKRQTVCQP